MSKEGLIWEGVRDVVLYLKVDSGLGLEAGGTALARALFHRVRDAEGGAEGAGTALSPRSGRRDCRSGSGARSSPTHGCTPMGGSHGARPKTKNLQEL
ncbi:MAG: hypothetical protein N2050_01940 [Flavobacteriales bacterium]|nr:hypothetical protein [Flavobacteriales bacterium]